MYTLIPQRWGFYLFLASFSKNALQMWTECANAALNMFCKMSYHGEGFEWLGLDGRFSSYLIKASDRT